jgi:hypothetical protein
MLESQQRVGFRDIVTGDESLFLHHCDHWQIWHTSGDEVPGRATHRMTAQKTILTLFLSVNGTILINSLTPGEKFNRGNFCEKTRAAF